MSQFAVVFALGLTLAASHPSSVSAQHPEARKIDTGLGDFHVAFKVLQDCSKMQVSWKSHKIVFFSCPSHTYYYYRLLSIEYEHILYDSKRHRIWDRDFPMVDSNQFSAPKYLVVLLKEVKNKPKYNHNTLGGRQIYGFHIVGNTFRVCP